MINSQWSMVNGQGNTHHAIRRWQVVAFVALALLAALLAGCSSTPAASSSPGINASIAGADWNLVPAGDFQMGLHNHETPLDYDYEMMVTDVTNEQFAAFLNDALADGAIKMGEGGIVGHYPGDEFGDHKHEREIKAGDWLLFPTDEPDARVSDNGGSFVSSAGYENHPATMVTWFGARAFCEYYDWRLPSEAEWEKAARGEEGSAFPWGEEIVKANANSYKSGDPFEKPGTVGDTTPVGFYNGQTHAGYQTIDSPSPYGLYDMAGNVWQWTGDVNEDTHLRYLKGGSFMDYEYNLRSWTRNSASPDYYSISVGFRCVREK